MDVMYWLIPLSIVVLIAAVAVFFWAVRNEQFKDLDSPAVEILLDDDEFPQENADKPKQRSRQNEN